MYKKFLKTAVEWGRPISRWEEVSLMSRSAEKWSSIGAAFYWIGLAFAIAAFFVVGATNTEIGERLEHGTVPLSWILAGIAIVALLACERCNSLTSPVADATAPAEPEAAASSEIAAQAFQNNA